MALTLADLQPGQGAVITELDGKASENQRLMHMGFVEGCDIQLVRKAPSGDPIEISIMGYALSIRKSDAERIQIEDPYQL